LYRFPHRAEYWCQIAKFTYLIVNTPIREWCRRNFAKVFSTRKTRMIGLPNTELKVWSVTDGRTDGIAMSISKCFIKQKKWQQRIKNFTKCELRLRDIARNTKDETQLQLAKMGIRTIFRLSEDCLHWMIICLKMLQQGRPRDPIWHLSLSSSSINHNLVGGLAIDASSLVCRQQSVTPTADCRPGQQNERTSFLPLATRRYE